MSSEFVDIITRGGNEWPLYDYLFFLGSAFAKGMHQSVDGARVSAETSLLYVIDRLSTEEVVDSMMVFAAANLEFLPAAAVHVHR